MMTSMLETPLSMNGTTARSDAAQALNGNVSMTNHDPLTQELPSIQKLADPVLPAVHPKPLSPLQQSDIVEQPVSDARDMPADVQMTEVEMVETVPLSTSAAEPNTTLGAQIEELSSATADVEMSEAPAESLLEVSSEPSNVVETLEETLTILPAAYDKSANDIAEPVVESQSIELTMAPKLESFASAQRASASPKPASSTGPAAPNPESSAPTSQAGQVRPRDEDEDDEPLAKRTKVEETETPVIAPPPAAEVKQDAVNASPAPAADQSSGDKYDFDSNPLTLGQKKYLADALRKTKKVKAAQPFLVPVDPIALNIPRYVEVIKQPMDLTTMEEKLKTDQYKCANDVWADLHLMYQNAVTFNGPNHPVSVHGMNLRAYFHKLMDTMPKRDEDFKAKKPLPLPRPAPPRRESRHAAAPPAPPPPPAPVVAKSPTVAKPKEDFKPQLDQNGMPIIRRDSTTDRPKRDIVKPQRDLPYNTPKPKKKKAVAELRFCEYVNKELAKPKHQKYAWPFQQAVDPVALNIPSYHKVIKKPMDFGTMGTKLNNGEYESSKDYFNDAKLVFGNCYKFNPPQDEIYKMGKLLEVAFDEAWAKKDEWLAQNAPPSEQVSEQEDDDEEEDEEEEAGQEAEQIRRLLEIQKQIAALSSEAMNLSTQGQVKKVKKVKVSGEKKQKRASLPGASSSKSSSKPKKPAKVKKLTLEEKRYVSEGIGQLDEPSMRKAVQIIRNGVPALKDVHDDELELDVDEIPEPVLQDLYRFVKSHRKAVGADITGEDEDWEEPSARRLSGSNKPAATQRKKNKPMSAREQEHKIAQVKKQLERFDHSGGDGPANDESSDDDTSSSSEEE